VPNPDHRKILLPVATGHSFEGATRYAADQATLLGCGIHVVTVLHPLHRSEPGVEELVLVEGELRKAGTEILTQVCHDLRGLLAGQDLPVSTELRHGPLTSELVELSADARLVVMQRRHHGRLARIVTMSTTNGLAARSLAPVVSVPATWDLVEPQRGPVLVGIEDPHDPGVGEEAVRLGLEMARRTGTSVELVHGWSFTEAYDDLVFANGGAGAESRDRRTRLMKTFAGLLAEYDDVDVEAVVEHARAAQLLVSSAGKASCLVVGRHHPSYPGGSHVGPITRAVLREAPCPVLVAPVRPT